MNSIPWYAFLIVAVVGLILAMAGKKSKKQGMAFFGTLIQLVGAILTICANNGLLRPASSKLLTNQWTTEAYGVANLIKNNFPGKRVAVLGWTPGPDGAVSANSGSSSKKGGNNVSQQMSQYMDALEKNGVSAKFVSVASFPPIGLSMDAKLDLIEKALDKAGDVDLIVYRNAVLPYEQIDLMERYLVIQTDNDQNADLWDEGIIVASVKAKQGVDPATYPGDFQTAYKECYEEKINSTKRD